MRLEDARYFLFNPVIYNELLQGEELENAIHAASVSIVDSQTVEIGIIDAIIESPFLGPGGYCEFHLVCIHAYAVDCMFAMDYYYLYARLDGGWDWDGIAGRIDGNWVQIGGINHPENYGW